MCIFLPFCCCFACFCGVGLVPSILSQEIGWEECLGNDLRIWPVSHVTALHVEVSMYVSVAFIDNSCSVVCRVSDKMLSDSAWRKDEPSWQFSLIGVDLVIQCGVGADNTVEENSSVFSLIRMH